MTPASTATRARIDRGSTDSRYESSWASNTSVHGIETTRASMPSSASRAAASIAIPTSEPVAMRIASPPSRSTYPPRGIAAICSAVRAWWGRPWRENRRLVGPWRRSIAACHAIIDSTASHGRHTDMFGINRNVAVCSTAWWVGPSSPRPMESWVNTEIVRWPISAAMRSAFRAYSENIRNVPVYGMKPPCRAMPLQIAVIANSRTPK